MLRLRPFTARQGDNSIVQPDAMPAKQPDERAENLLRAAKAKYDKDTLLITAGQRTMVTLKAISNTRDR